MSNYRYKRVFEDNDSQDYNPIDKAKNAQIADLGYSMSGRSISTRRIKHPLKKKNKKYIPAGYTYLGQFIAHDISFQSNTDRESPHSIPWDPDANKSPIFNKRTPFFDLETIYGNESPEDPKKPPRAELMEIDTETKLPSKTKLRLGMTDGTTLWFPNDLPRKNGSLTADIVDRRNDDNLLLAQTQVLFIKFHNAVVKHLEGEDSNETFERAKKIVIRYYQRIVLDDFLPQMVLDDELERSIDRVLHKPDELFYKPSQDDMFLPFEFTAGALRFGHSMILGGYNVNRFQKNITISMLRVFTGTGGMNANNAKIHTGLPTTWVMNWNLFYEITSPAPSGFNKAAKINTELTQRILALENHSKKTDAPVDAAIHANIPNNNARKPIDSVASLDLFRGFSLNLWSGQKIARELGVSPISAKEISDLLLTKKIDNKHPESPAIMKPLEQTFGKETPLWFYILAEAEIQTGGTSLGELGSRLLAEVMIKLIFESPVSVLRSPNWENGEDWLLENGKFRMPQMLRFIQKSNSEYDEINPLGEVKI